MAPVTGGRFALAALTMQPTDVLLDELSSVLRNFPEVEWACLAMLSDADGPPQPAVLLRVDPTFRSRVAEIEDSVNSVSHRLQAGLVVALADEPSMMKAARQVGKPFFPWRK